MVCITVCLHLHILCAPENHIKTKTGPHLLCILITVLYTEYLALIIAEIQERVFPRVSDKPNLN